SRDDRDVERSRAVRDRHSVRNRRDRPVGSVPTARRRRRAKQAPGSPQQKLKTSVCAGSSFLFLSSWVVAEWLASAVPVRKLRKNGGVLRVGTRKGAGMTENVKEISHAKTQRRKEDPKGFGSACVFFAPLRLCVRKPA